MPISTNIRAICNHLNARNQGISTDAPNDIGCFASVVAEVAKLAGIPENEDIYESMGARSFYHRKSSSDNSFSELGPSYMKTREHKHWYHLGQSYQHAASWSADPDFDSNKDLTTRHQQRHLHLQLNYELAAQLGTSLAAVSSRDISSSVNGGLLQFEMSGNSSQEKSMDYSSSSTPTSATSVSTNASFLPAPHDSYLA